MSPRTGGIRSSLNLLARATLPALALLAAGPLPATIIDRIAAIADREVITLSAVNQIMEIRLIPKNPGEAEDAHRRRVLETMIAQALRFRDVERFGAEDVPKDSIESKLKQMIARFPSEESFYETLGRVEITLDESRALIKRQLQVEQYVDERFAPLIFVSLEEIENYYRSTWSSQRRERGLAVPALGEVREEIRSLLKSERLQEEIDKWTLQLRNRANVDIYMFR